jgi:hypothetical protein
MLVDVLMMILRVAMCVGVKSWNARLTSINGGNERL